MKSTIRFLIWLMILNLLMNFIFPEPVELWKFIFIEICLGFLSFIMVDWKEDKWGERVKLTIDIPKGYERDFIADKFKDFFSRVIADINCDGMCGFYEKEIAEMFLEAFDKAIIGDVNLNAKVIPVVNMSFNEEDIRKMIQDELKKFQIENNLI